MPSYVITEKCDGCKGQDKTACMYICPVDLMNLDKDGSLGYGEMKAYNRDTCLCWECYNCVKICPNRRLTFVGMPTSSPWVPVSLPFVDRKTLCGPLSSGMAL